VSVRRSIDRPGARESEEPFDRWHKRYPKPGDAPCRCGTKKNPLYPSSDHGRGNRWQARYTDPNGKQRRPTFETWQEARDHLDAVRVQMRTNTWSDPDVGRETVEFYAYEMLERKRRKKKAVNTLRAYEQHIRNHIVPFAGQREARSLRRRDSLAFVDYLCDKPGVNSGSSVRDFFATWRIVINYMIDEDIPLPANITSRIELPEANVREFCPEPVQVVAMAQAMRKVAPRYEIMIWIAACAGMRYGEVAGITRSRVRDAKKVISIEEQRQQGKATKLKTKSSKANLPVDGFLIARIEEHIKTFPRVEPVSAETEARRRRQGYKVRPDEDLLVTTPHGGPVPPGSFHDKWQEAKELAEMPDEFLFHSLKKFYTTELAESGDYGAKTVQVMSRHARFQETWDTYAKVRRKIESVDVTTFSKLFGQARSSDLAQE
jgi:integrase